MFPLKYLIGVGGAAAIGGGAGVGIYYGTRNEGTLTDKKPQVDSTSQLSQEPPSPPAPAASLPGEASESSQQLDNLLSPGPEEPAGSTETPNTGGVSDPAP